MIISLCLVAGCVFVVLVKGLFDVVER